MNEAPTPLDEALAAVSWAIGDVMAVVQGLPRSEPSAVTWRWLKLTGAAWLWESAEVAVLELRGDRLDEADCDEPPEDWYDAGAQDWWLEKHADDLPTFILGIPAPNWLWDGDAKGPVMISASRLWDRKARFPASRVPVYIDSGGFTEVTSHGGHRHSPEEYAALIRRCVAELGMVEWATVQDWMCEPAALARTGLTIEEHQRRTVESFLRLRALAPEVRWLPVIQGYELPDYTRHVAMYREAGVWLGELRCVGVGSVCKRNRAPEIRRVLANLRSDGALPMRLHGFGVKAEGLAAARTLLWSADSMAWSYRGRVLTRDAETAAASPQTTFAFAPAPSGRDEDGHRLSWSPDFAEQWRTKMDAYAQGTAHVAAAAGDASTTGGP